MALQRSQKFDMVMAEIFCNRKSTIIGFGFNSDIEQFACKHPQFKFIRYIANFIDAQSYYGKVYLIEQQTGLTKVAHHMFGKNVCKVE